MSDFSNRMPLDQLKETEEYQCLTPKQKLFVATYCEGGLVDGNYDPVIAVMVAYKCKSIETARVMSYSMMQSLRIIAVLNRHFNKTPIEDVLVQVNRAIHNKKVTNAQVQALRLKCEILGIPSMFPTRMIEPSVAAVRREQAAAKRKTERKDAAEKEKESEPSKFGFGF